MAFRLCMFSCLVTIWPPLNPFHCFQSAWALLPPQRAFYAHIIKHVMAIHPLRKKIRTQINNSFATSNTRSLGKTWCHISTLDMHTILATTSLRIQDSSITVAVTQWMYSCKDWTFCMRTTVGKVMTRCIIFFWVGTIKWSRIL